MTFRVQPGMRPWARRDELSLNCWVPGIYGGSKNNLVELYEKQATSLPDKASKHLPETDMD